VRLENIKLTRTDGKIAVTGRVVWNTAGLTRYDMRFGDLRLVAVSAKGHLPTVLKEESRTVTGMPQPIAITVDDTAATKPGNRIALAASQHPQTGAELTPRTYVTVRDAQPFSTPQAHIGTRDCSDQPILPGAQLNYCDLVGADLDGAFVSDRDDKADEGRVPSRSTRLLRADLTGATAVRANFSGASIAGGRLNGADFRQAKLDNLSLAGAEAIDLDAAQATSDPVGRSAGANFFGTRLDRANFDGSVFHGVSIVKAVLDDATARKADWTAIVADRASLRGAHLDGTTFGLGTMYFADLTGATLTGTDVNDILLAWPILCRTELPPQVLASGNRDCPTAVEPDKVPAPNPDRPTPYVRISDARLDKQKARVTATISWDATSFPGAGGMTVGDVRVVAVEGDSGRAHVLAERSYDPLTATTNDPLAIGDDARQWLRDGNRVVVTATQRPPASPRFGSYVGRAYVTVATLQRGPGRGQVGKYDCSRIALQTVNQRGPDGLSFCDLTGASLIDLDLGERFMRDVDLSGAEIGRSRWVAVTLDGSSLADVSGRDAVLTNVNAVQARAPGLALHGGVVRGSVLLFADATGLDLTDGLLQNDVQMNNVPLRDAVFTNAMFDHVDLALADLRGAQLDGVDATNNASSLFLADLSGATLEDSAWHIDEDGVLPFTWSTLCHTTMPRVAGGIDGDRDCPRVPRGAKKR
jgi:uncharacterized protein YjbI with pentapeptide repeats